MDATVLQKDARLQDPSIDIQMAKISGDEIPFTAHIRQISCRDPLLEMDPPQPGDPDYFPNLVLDMNDDDEGVRLNWRAMMGNPESEGDADDVDEEEENWRRWEELMMDGGDDATNSPETTDPENPPTGYIRTLKGEGDDSDHSDEHAVDNPQNPYYDSDDEALWELQGEEYWAAMGWGKNEEGWWVFYGFPGQNGDDAVPEEEENANDPGDENEPNQPIPDDLGSGMGDEWAAWSETEETTDISWDPDEVRICEMCGGFWWAERSQFAILRLKKWNFRKTFCWVSGRSVIFASDGRQKCLGDPPFSVASGGTKECDGCS